jgi:ABC-type polysaccharide/polyol phosphate transport system ATPase subunit
MKKAESTIILRDVVLDFPFHNAGRTTLRKQFMSMFKRENRNWFRAINGINMEVKRGEVVGFIGSNGAGKSTLMRIIAGIYKPDRGVVVTEGRVTLLASLGLGFSSDLPGRDNIYLAGGLLGLSDEELSKLEPDIIEFSGLGQFIDAPIRTYSAGMRARLGFAVACHSNPDILLLDEVFSVGDYEFRKKSRQMIQEMVEGDTTVVITSHNIGTLKQMCDRLLYIESGKILVDDDNDLAMELYEKE